MIGQVGQSKSLAGHFQLIFFQNRLHSAWNETIEVYDESKLNSRKI